MSFKRKTTRVMLKRENANKGQEKQTKGKRSKLILTARTPVFARSLVVCLLSLFIASSPPHFQYAKDLKGEGFLELFDFDAMTGALSPTERIAMPEPLWATAWESEA